MRVWTPTDVTHLRRDAQLQHLDLDAAARRQSFSSLPRIKCAHCFAKKSGPAST